MATVPFGDFGDVRGEMDRMFAEMPGAPARWPGRRDDPQGAWVPAIEDAFTREGDLVIRDELPGIRQEEVDVTLHGGILTVYGERKADREQNSDELPPSGSMRRPRRPTRPRSSFDRDVDFSAPPCHNVVLCYFVI